MRDLHAAGRGEAGDDGMGQGLPACRQHVADSIANTNGQPKILPPPGSFAPSRPHCNNDFEEPVG
jgi:hypothetical protein